MRAFPGNDERMSVLHQDSGGIGKSIPSALEISLGHGFCTPQPSGFPSGFALGKSLGSRGAKPISQDFPRPLRFPSDFALGNLSGLGKSWASGMDFPIPPSSWWSTDTFMRLIPNLHYDFNFSRFHICPNVIYTFAHICQADEKAGPSSSFSPVCPGKKAKKNCRKELPVKIVAADQASACSFLGINCSLVGNQEDKNKCRQSHFWP